MLLSPAPDLLVAESRKDRADIVVILIACIVVRTLINDWFAGFALEDWDQEHSARA